MALSEATLRRTAQWFTQFAADWREEIPLRIHTRGVDAGGAPEMHPDFLNYLDASYLSSLGRGRRNPDHRLRTTRAFRKLRKEAPREYEVLYRTMVLGEPVSETTRWLNERAIRGGHPERYTKTDTMVIVVAGVDFVHHWW